MSKIEIKNLNLYYGTFQALKDINIDIRENEITAVIGPSGCGKTTLLRAFNRMNDLIDGVKTTGEVILDGEDIYKKDVDLSSLRKKVGMVFQRPNPFPLSIYENIAYGLKVHGEGSTSKIKEIVERSLSSVLLFSELKDRLNEGALSLTLEGQQRLCIARLLAVTPQVILLDEPCSVLDPIATLKIEELMKHLKKEYTIVIVTHNMQQAARVSDYTAFMLLGELVEFGTTEKVFTAPSDKRTEDYITGRFG